MNKIPLTRGLFAIVDDADFEKFGRFKWNANPMRHLQKTSFYAIRWIPGGLKKVLLHRLIMGDPKGMDVDHRDGNTLDCRRKNLRCATQAETTRNRGKTSKKTTSIFKGVHFDPHPRHHLKPWKATIGSRKEDGGKIPRRHLGCFASEAEAARAYDAAAQQLFQQFARLNFP